MNKIIGIICMGGIGLLYSVVLVAVYILALFCLFMNEIIGTKKFKNKFERLNKLIIDEFKNTFKSYKNILGIA